MRNQTDSCWTAFSKKIENAYIIDKGMKTVTEVNFDPKNVVKSSIVKQYKFAGIFWIMILLPFVELTTSMFSVSSGSIEVLSLAGRSGKAAVVQEYAYVANLASRGIRTDGAQTTVFATYVF
ncbi:hypothetical protein M422DRAFT_264195 [Sphaerobolus stellatus SS14]|uniref:Unplaced genomic scaffold SPHSTscaffold_133, whole genome shotgun sequence n=1 Tax=Sphaerobolus stellatus (strain SS14) TaxID=990650 RepID=A0A0C9TTQ4_SPHS4|nr:hypothetical protein M422DRAFT_264195 [Sphaerobolus stellatus SS14]